MASEWTLLNCPNADGFLRTATVTVANGTAITKGTLMVMSADPNTAIAHAGLNDIPLGIALADKVANDGTTRIAIALDGDWDAYGTTGSAIGDIIVPSATANQFETLTVPGVTYSTRTFARMMGKCLETASAGECVRVRLNLG